MSSPRVYAALLLWVALAGLPALRFELLEWDDPTYVTRNPLVIAPGTGSLSEQLLTPALGYPVPLTVLSYRLEYALAGPSAWLFHLDNVILHALAVVLAFLLAGRVGLTRAGATLAALGFGLHPGNAEVVSWVTGRKDLLCAVFCFAALLWARSERRHARALSVGAYALALLSKPVAEFAIALVPCLSHVREAPRLASARERVIDAARTLLPYALVAVPIGVLGLRGHAALGGFSEGGHGAMSHARGALYALGHHARIALFLEPPTVKYLPAPWPPAFPSATELTAVALCVLCALALFLLSPERKRPALFGLAFAALTYLPSSSLLFPLARFLADSYLYLPSFGLALVLGALLDEALARAVARERLGFTRVLRALPYLVALALLPAFWSSSARFENDLALWSHARRRFPHQVRVCREWSNAVVDRFGPVAGLAAIDRCIAEFGDALFVKNRGLVLAGLGRREEAITWLTRAQRVAPGDKAIAHALAALGN